MGFVDAVTLPAPRVDETWAQGVVRESFGMDAVAHQLGSNQDANFLMRSPGGEPVAVLKVSNPAFSASAVAVQDDAADRIAAACPELRVAHVLRDGKGAVQRTSVATPDGPVVARLIRFLDGGTLFDQGYLAPRSVARLGEVAAKVDLALADLTIGEGLDRVLQWDLQYADQTVAALGSSLPAARRAEIESAAAGAWRLLAPLVPDLPMQVVHLDLTDDNTVLGADGLVDGVIDFSDLTRTWTVSELAIAISSVLHHPGAEPASVLPAVRAYHSVRPLSEAEVDAIWPLVVLRAAVLVASGCHQVAVDGDNDYAETRLVKEWRIADQALSIPPEVMTGVIRDALGLGTSGDGIGHPPRRVFCSPSRMLRCWTCPRSRRCCTRGRGRTPTSSRTLAADRLAGGDRAVVTTFGEARLAGSSRARSRVAGLGADGDRCMDGRIRGTHRAVGLRGGRRRVRHGAARRRAWSWWRAPSTFGDGSVAAGTVVATTAPRTRTRITWGLRAASAPEAVAAQYAPGWLATLADPAPLLGLPAKCETSRTRRSPCSSNANVRSPRSRSTTTSSRPGSNAAGATSWSPTDAPSSTWSTTSPSSATPTRVSPGDRRAAAAAAEHQLPVQLRRRSPSSVLGSPRPRARSAGHRLPGQLRLGGGRPGDSARARRHRPTRHGRDARGVPRLDLCLGCGLDLRRRQPQRLASRPSWVHTVPRAQPLPGSASRWRCRPVRARGGRRSSTSSQRPARPPGAFIAEAYYGNAGGIALPDGYLAAVYSAVRRHGGLTIADEIQVGYGRLGTGSGDSSSRASCPTSSPWRRRVGNGIPLGAVITSRADRRQVPRCRATSSPRPAAARCPQRIGLAVLDIIRDEDLQANARIVGAHLKARLEELGDATRDHRRRPWPRLVPGGGMVRDRTTLEPATERNRRDLRPDARPRRRRSSRRATR